MSRRAPVYQFLDTSRIASARTVEFVPSTNLTAGSSQKAFQAIRLGSRSSSERPVVAH
jgi:hypothetical protein